MCYSKIPRNDSHYEVIEYFEYKIVCHMIISA